MNRHLWIAMTSLCWIAGLVLFVETSAAEESFTRTEDVIYGRKFGTALTLDVFVPKENAHGWPELGNDTQILADWFDKHLAKK